MTFGTLAVLVAAGLAGPLLAAAVPGVVPVVVGEIAAGVALGAAGLGWIDPDEPVVAFLAKMGFALLMFVAGTHVPLRDPHLRGALRAGAMAAALTAALATATAIALATWLGVEAGVLVLCLATSSAAIALPLLRERRVTSEAALVALAWVTIADVATIMALPILLHGDGAARVAAGSLGVSALALGVWLLARVTRERGVAQRLRAQSKRLEWALDLRLSLLALAGLAYAAERAGTSILVAGFSAGLIVAAVGEPRRLARQVRGLAHGFLVPVFFVVLGARLDIVGLDLRTCAAVLVAGAAIRIVVGATLRLPLGVGLLAAATLGVPAAVVEVGLDEGFLDAGQAAGIIAAALGSIAFAALGSDRLHRQAPQEPAGQP